MHEDLKATRRVRLLFESLAAGLTDFVKGDRRAGGDHRGPAVVSPAQR
jgi:hypothetical protein